MNPTSITKRKPDVVVAGHICLDVIPQFPDELAGGRVTLRPGRLIHVGPSLQVTGGAVANTGLALHKLGVPTRLIGKLGNDPYGHRILEILKCYNASMLVDSMIVDDADATSYTIVISLSGSDRIFLHCPGANDTFAAEDMPWEQISTARLLHFGYPPLMRRIYEQHGEQMSMIFQKAKSLGLITSLDMSVVDPSSDPGRVEWEAWMTHVLPSVDLFLPSLDEILFMLGRERAGGPSQASGFADPLNGLLLENISRRLLEMGAAIVAIKLGEQGLYLRTTSNLARVASLSSAGLNDAAAWCGREMWSPCFRADFCGATGAGDCTIAGFLAGLLAGGSPSEVLNTAVAVGAYSVEAPDATGGIPSWPQVRQRMDAAWQKHATAPPSVGWRSSPKAQLWLGPNDPVE